MQISRLPILPIILLGAMSVVGFWIYKNVSWIEIDTPTGQKKIARENPLLAAQRLLETQGFSVSEAKIRLALRRLDTSNAPGLIWFTDIEQVVTTKEAQTLQAWVEAGGHLIAGFNRYPARSNANAGLTLLEDLGIVIDYAITTDASERTPHYERSNATDERVNIPTENGKASEQLIVETRQRPFLHNHPNNILLDNSNGRKASMLVQTQVGKGFVTSYSEFDLFKNNRINTDDQAYLLLWLTQATQQKVVQLVFTLRNTPGLFKNLWRKIPLTMVLLLVALALYLWHASRRLGPVEYQTEQGQNNLIAHLRARGLFHHKHKHKRELLEPVQQAVISKFSHQLNFSQAAQLDDHAKAAIVKQAAEVLGESTTHTKKALFGTFSSESEMMRHSSILHKLLHKKSRKPESEKGANV